MNLWQNCGAATRKTVSSRSTLPESLSTQTTPSAVPSSVAVVSQTCAPQITGEDHALPWMAVFHFTCSVSLNFTGSPVASLCPSPAGPRNCGQFSAVQSVAAQCSAAVKTARRGRSLSEDKGGGVG